MTHPIGKFSQINKTLCLGLVVGFVLLFFLVKEGRAADSGIEGTQLRLFNPTFDNAGFFGVHGAATLPQHQLSLKIHQELRHAQLFRVAVGANTIDFIKTLYTVDYLASFGVTDFLTVGVDVPVHFYSLGEVLATGTGYKTMALGDVRPAVQFRLFAENRPRELPAVSVFFSLATPTGNERKFLGWDSVVVPEVLLLLEQGIGTTRWRLNLGARFPGDKDIQGIHFDHHLLYGFAGLVPLRLPELIFDVFAELQGQLQPDEVQNTTAPAQWTVGLHREFGNFSLSLGGGTSLNNAVGNSNLRGMLSVGYDTRKSNQKKNAAAK